MTRQTYDRAPRLTKLATAHISKGGYADDIALLSPSLTGINMLLDKCAEFASEYVDHEPHNLLVPF